MPKPKAVILDYADASLKRRVSFSYRAILIMGGAPLVCGLAIFLLYWFTQRSWLVLAGLMTIGIGIYLVGAGGIGLVIYYLHERRVGRMPAVVLRRRVLVAALLLISNFPIGFVCMVAAPLSHHGY